MAYFYVETNKNALSYAVGEEIVFSVTYKDSFNIISCPRFKWEIKGDDGQASSGEASFIAEPCRTRSTHPVLLRASCARPGFVLLILTALNPDGTVKDTPFRFSAGVAVDKLNYLGNIPDDFDEFWEKAVKTAADFTPEIISMTPYASAPAYCDAWDVHLTAPCGPASGILTIPKGEGPFPLVITFRGYGYCGAQIMPLEREICFSLNSFGMENDKTDAEFYAAHAAELNSYGFDETENARPETTFWYGMMMRNLVACKWAKTLEKWDKKTLTAFGGSQAALQATTLAAHDEDVTYLHIRVPWFCNLHAEENGYLPGWRPKPAPGLEYFDTVAQATRVTCPVEIEARLGDAICPPTSVATLYNAFPGKKKLLFVQGGDHGPILPERLVFPLEYDPEDPVIAPGRYRHFKGGVYEVLSHARDSETDTDVVIYRGENGKVWTRPAHEWHDLLLINGTRVKRFTRLDP